MAWSTQPEMSVFSLYSKEQTALKGFIILFVLFSTVSLAQQIGKAVIPKDVLMATVLIERAETHEVTAYVAASNLVLVVERQGTNTALIPAENLFRQIKTNEVSYTPLGSGVLVLWSNRFFIVTAGHVIPSDGNVSFRIPQNNGKPPEHRPHKEISQSSGMGWVRSTNADIILTTISLQQEVDEVKVVPIENFAATYEKVSVGDDVFIAGYPVSVVSVADQAVHVIRNGIVSAKMGNGMILIDAFTFPGNSGGPVFWKPAAGLNIFGPIVEGRETWLVGIVLYSHSYTEEAFSPVTGRKRITFESNSGLTEIVSTSRILDLFDYPQVHEAFARWTGKK